MTEPAGPLSGIVVVDLTRVLAGPYCTMVLSDLGARVIKVETPEVGDDARHIGPFINEKSAYFMSLNRGKESIALNLKGDDGRAIFEQLLARADVLVENYRPGVMEKLGYSWDDLKDKYPKLIYAAASGFGHTGPYRERAAYDMVVQGMGGIMSITGHPGGPPTRVGSSVGDITAGMFTTIGVNAALYHRAETGQGMKIDVAMLDSQLAILENAIARYAATGESPGPIGARHPSITPFAALKTQDGYVMVAAGNEKLFASFCDAIERPDLVQDSRFATNDLRTQNVDVLTAEIEAALAHRPTKEWLDAFDAGGIPCGPLNNIAQVMNDPQIRARNMVVTVEDPVTGTLELAGNPIKMSAFADPSTRGAVPDLDGNRQSITDWLDTFNT
jgi:CoA:oxalate CoA-transferase